MTRVYKQEQAKNLGLPGRKSLEILSGESGSRSVTLRLVEIPVEQEGGRSRGPHKHSDCEECIFVLSGEGTTRADSGEYPLKTGDAILISAGENHVTRNAGSEPLVLLCFFPLSDISSSMQENLSPTAAKEIS